MSRLAEQLNLYSTDMYIYISGADGIEMYLKDEPPGTPMVRCLTELSATLLLIALLRGTKYCGQVADALSVIDDTLQHQASK